MADVISRRGRRRRRTAPMPAAALEYAQFGWPVARGAEPGSPGMGSCTCDRLGCPAPGAHPMSAAWGLESTTDHSVVSRWWAESPNANIILPTGRTFDVIDVPANAGMLALAQIGRSGTPCGPVAAVPGQRYHFFVATRGAPEDENEWWSCRLDSRPDTVEDSPGLRWHCRDSYVVAPPSLLPSGVQATWIRAPEGDISAMRLPDPIAILDVLADTAPDAPH